MADLARRNPPQWRGGLLPYQLGGLFDQGAQWAREQLTPRAFPSLEQLQANAAARGPVTPEEVASFAVDMASPFAKVGGLLGHTVWHGSPHKWDVPDISKVGTGEGAQAYGHGFYSAESKPIAEYYAETLGGLGWKTPEAAGKYNPNTLDAIKKEIPYKTLEEIMQMNKQYADLGAEGGIMADMYNAIKSGDVGLTGSLYKLDIPDEDIPKYLDWDKPLSEQAEDVQTAFYGAIERAMDRPEGVLESVLDEVEAGTISGERIYRMLVNDEVRKMAGGQGAALSAHPDKYRVSAEALASRNLAGAGIPGIRYLDGNSRGAGQGTYNYVTFDPSRIKVLERK